MYYTGSSRSKACLSVVIGYVNVSHEMDNLNMSPKMSYGVLECDIVTELHAYDFVIKRRCNTKGALFVPDPIEWNITQR